METTRKTVLSVEGMTCPSCITHVRSALTDLDGVTRVDVQLREGKVAVEHEEQGPSLEAMIQALREAGYGSAPTPQA